MQTSVAIHIYDVYVVLDMKLCINSLLFNLHVYDFLYIPIIVGIFFGSGANSDFDSWPHIKDGVQLGVVNDK